MSEHVAFIVQVGHLEKHPNADRLQVVEFFGNSTMVDMNVHEGDVGIYFPIDLQLSEEFCTTNNLVRRKDETGKNVGGYLDPEKRNITAMRLRGSKSEGLYLPLTCLKYIYGENEIPLKVGDKFDVLDGHEICCKYIPKRNHARQHGGANKVKTVKKNIAPLFLEHVETEQLAYNMDAFKPGDQVELTLKMHGTSGRTGYLPVLKGYKRTLFDRIFRREGKPIYEYGYISGTRRTVLNFDDVNGGFYGDNTFRHEVEEQIRGKLFQGEEIYYEIVGWAGPGVTIMPVVDNKKTQDKAFIKQYGPQTTFSYGCEPDTHDFYVYRMTMTGPDGHVVEYTPDYMRYRCEQMGLKTVPVFWKGYIPEKTEHIVGKSADECYIEVPSCTPGEWVKDLCEQYYDGADPVGKTHVREGVVARIVNRPSFTAFKHKNFSFKVLSGIAVAAAADSDTEMSDDILSEI